ncbi:HNH endonuclease [Streptomyces asiaticus]|uniref:HNH endonuclease signature motif containing protein n=1 Tax=Streptomyces asiaticus TaxID=114695 RepID=UPI003D749BD4
MNRRATYSQEVLVRSAAQSRSLVDMMRRLGAPLGSGTRRYLRKRLDHYGIDTSHFAEEPLPGRPRMSYSRERLEEAAAHSHSVREMLAFMEIPPYDYSHLRKKLEQFGIDTAHFTGKRGTARERLLPRSALARAVSDSYSVAGVLRLLEIPVGGAGRSLVRRSVAAYGISTAHFTGRGHRRGHASPQRKSASTILQRLDPGSTRTRTAVLRRALDESGVPQVCDGCGTGDSWQGRRLILEIDHINGDRLDNRIGNLRYLCPSCHSQTKNFSGRGRQGTTTWR